MWTCEHNTNKENTMKLEDINESVFQTLSPEVQSQLIESASVASMNNTFFATVGIAILFTFAYLMMKET